MALLRVISLQFSLTTFQLASRLSHWVSLSLDLTWSPPLKILGPLEPHFSISLCVCLTLCMSIYRSGNLRIHSLSVCGPLWNCVT